jgi:hypothetical protein
MQPNRQFASFFSTIMFFLQRSCTTPLPRLYALALAANLNSSIHSCSYVQALSNSIHMPRVRCVSIVVADLALPHDALYSPAIQPLLARLPQPFCMFAALLHRSTASFLCKP